MLKQIFVAFLSLTNLSYVPDTKRILDHHEVHDQQKHFNHDSFLTSWNDASFNMESAMSIAFERYKNNLIEQQEAKTDNYDTTREEQALEKLASENLVPGTIRVRYHNGRGYISSYLQLENSYCWHYGDCFPTLYLHNEKKLSNQADTLKTLISAEKKPKVTVYLSRKRPLQFSQSKKILYSIDLDFTKSIEC